MPFDLESVKTFSMPEDGALAEEAFLSVLYSHYPTWLEMYGATLKPLFDAIKAAITDGIVLDILLDKLQECGHTEHPIVLDLVEFIKAANNGSCLTVTTAGVDAEKSSEIAHRKRIMDGAGYVFFGSVNASHDGFYSQTNDAVYFIDGEYVKQAVETFNRRKAWAREHLASSQLMDLPEQENE